jgi:hypothetical protein
LRRDGRGCGLGRLQVGDERYREPIIASNETRRAIADEGGQGGQELMHKAG